MTTQGQLYYHGTGKRKTAIASVRLYASGSGTIIINGKPLTQFFPLLSQQAAVAQPLKVTSTADRFNVMVKVIGGGPTGQAEAVRHGIARALLSADPSLKGALREHSLLTRDAREKERKKYGLKGARKAKQSPKR